MVLTESSKTSYSYLYLYVGCTLAAMIIVYLAVVCFAEFCLSGQVNLHNSMVSKLMHQRITFFDVTPRGRIENRISKDVDSIDTVLPPYYLGGIMGIIVVLGSVISVCALNWPAVIIAIPILILFVAIYLNFRQLSP